MQATPYTRGGPADTRFGDCAPPAAAKLEAVEDEREGAKVWLCSTCRRAWRTSMRASDLQHTNAHRQHTPRGEGTQAGGRWAVGATHQTSSQGARLGQAVAISAPSARRARPYIRLRAGSKRPRQVGCRSSSQRRPWAVSRAARVREGRGGCVGAHALPVVVGALHQRRLRRSRLRAEAALRSEHRGGFTSSE